MKSNLNKEEQQSLYSAKKIAVISALGSTMKVNSIGGTIFDNSQYDVDISHIKTDTFLENSLVAKLKKALPGVAIDNYPQLQSRPTIGGDDLFTTVNQKLYEKLLSELKKANYDYVFLIRASDDSNNKFLTQPFGLSESQAREEVHVYQNANLTIIKLADKSIMKYTPLYSGWDGSNRSELLEKGITVADKKSLQPEFIKKSVTKIMALIKKGLDDYLNKLFSAKK